MGKVITLPVKRAEIETAVSADRYAAFVTGVCAMTYLLGFFIAGPMLAIYFFGFATTAHPLAALTCVGGLVIVWALTRAAYKRI